MNWVNYCDLVIGSRLSSPAPSRSFRFTNDCLEPSHRDLVPSTTQLEMIPTTNRSLAAKHLPKALVRANVSSPGLAPVRLASTLAVKPSPRTRFTSLLNDHRPHAKPQQPLSRSYASDSPSAYAPASFNHTTAERARRTDRTTRRPHFDKILIANR